MEKHIDKIIKSVNNSKEWVVSQKEQTDFVLGVDSIYDLLGDKLCVVKVELNQDLHKKIEQLIELNQPAAKRITCKEKYDELVNKYLEILNS